jgi:hypothetical protein
LLTPAEANIGQENNIGLTDVLTDVLNIGQEHRSGDPLKGVSDRTDVPGKNEPMFVRNF